MNANAVLDVSIGLIMMYLLLSIVCTAVNEYLATVFKLRANTLKAALTKVIDAPVLLATFYNHGMIRSAYPKKDMHPSYLSGQTFAQALLGSLNPTTPLPVFDDIKQAILDLPHGDIRDVLLTNMTAAEGDLTRFRDHIARWFDTYMDRIGGLYKRRLKVVTILVGFLLALLINADSISVAGTLWKDDALRQQIAVIGSQVAAQQQACSSDQKDCVPALPPNEIAGYLERFPIGWPSNFWHTISVSGWVIKLLGIVFTALALSLGAPFWFDLLSRFVNIRGNGAKPERTPQAVGSGVEAQ
jgi:hypothetical protein